MSSADTLKTTLNKTEASDDAEQQGNAIKMRSSATSWESHAQLVPCGFAFPIKAAQQIQQK